MSACVSIRAYICNIPARCGWVRGVAGGAHWAAHDVPSHHWSGSIGSRLGARVGWWGAWVGGLTRSASFSGLTRRGKRAWHQTGPYWGGVGGGDRRGVGMGVCVWGGGSSRRRLGWLGCTWHQIGFTLGRGEEQAGCRNGGWGWGGGGGVPAGGGWDDAGVQPPPQKKIRETSMCVGTAVFQLHICLSPIWEYVASHDACSAPAACCCWRSWGARSRPVAELGVCGIS